jgi:hypothetical protein
MRFSRSILIIAAIMIATMMSQLLYAQPTNRRMSPNELVADLYKQHDRKHSPFFQTRSRASLDKYFEKSLAAMIWKDAVSSKGEVGVIDGDPLYDAQDMEIKNFAIGKAVFQDGKARVNVSFENFGQKKSIIFLLVNGRTGWRISDIDYGTGRTLVGEFKESRR